MDTLPYTLYSYDLFDSKGHHDRNISCGVLLYSGLHPIPLQHCTYQHFILHSITPRPILSSANLSRTHTLPYPILAHCRGSLLRNCLYTLKYALRQSPIYHGSISPECREKLFRNCHTNVPNPEKYISRWLMVSEGEYIKRDNVKDFIRWAFFGPGHTREQDQRNEEEIETYTTEIEKMIGRKLSPGRMDVKSLGQLLNEAGGSHRSLLWYTVSSLSLFTLCDGTLSD